MSREKREEMVEGGVVVYLIFCPVLALQSIPMDDSFSPIPFRT